jgi:hypothetical protein
MQHAEDELFSHSHEAYCAAMHDDVIAHMRDRIARMRKIMALAHDQVMIAIIAQMIAEAEVDIERLEAERGTEPNLLPPQTT